MTDARRVWDIHGTTMVPGGYEVVETDARVSKEPELRTRFRRRADRRCARLNAIRVSPSYRWVVVRERGRYVVHAFQNVLRPIA